MKLNCNALTTVLDLHWNRSEIALKSPLTAFEWMKRNGGCSGTALKLLGNRSAPKFNLTDWICSETALEFNGTEFDTFQCNSFLKSKINCPEPALKLPWDCSETALKLSRHSSGIWMNETKWKMFQNCSEIALKLPWNCSAIALRLFRYLNEWNELKNDLKLLWNCSEIALKLLWNCSEIALRLSGIWMNETKWKMFPKLSETALKLLLNCS